MSRSFVNKAMVRAFAKNQNVRISRDAITLVTTEVEKILTKAMREAIKTAKYANRKTVLPRDFSALGK